MHIPLIIRCMVHPSQFPDNYDDHLISKWSPTSRRVWPEPDPVQRYMGDYLTEDNWFITEFAVSKSGHLSCSFKSRFSGISHTLTNLEPELRWQEANRIARLAAAEIVGLDLMYYKLIDPAQERLLYFPEVLVISRTFKTIDGISVSRNEVIPNDPDHIIRFIDERRARNGDRIYTPDNDTPETMKQLLRNIASTYPFLKIKRGFPAWHILDFTENCKRPWNHIETIYLIDMHV